MARRILVVVKANARASAITKKNENEFRAAVREPARDGKANRGLIDLLALYFDIRKSAVTIVRGHSSRRKLIELVK